MLFTFVISVVALALALADPKTPQAAVPKLGAGSGWNNNGDLFLTLSFYEDAVRNTGRTCNDSLLTYQHTFVVGSCFGLGGNGNVATGNGPIGSLYVSYGGQGSLSIMPWQFGSYAECEDFQNGGAGSLSNLINLSNGFSFTNEITASVPDVFESGVCNDGFKATLSTTAPDYTGTNGIGFTLYQTYNSNGDASMLTQICEELYMKPTYSPAGEKVTPKSPKVNETELELLTLQAINGYAWFATGVCTWNFPGRFGGSGGSVIYSYDAATATFTWTNWSSDDCGVSGGDSPLGFTNFGQDSYCDTALSGAFFYPESTGNGDAFSYGHAAAYSASAKKGKVKKTKPSALRRV